MDTPVSNTNNDYIICHIYMYRKSFLFGGGGKSEIFYIELKIIIIIVYTARNEMVSLGSKRNEDN